MLWLAGGGSTVVQPDGVLWCLGGGPARGNAPGLSRRLH